MALPAKLRLLCPGLDFVDLVVFEPREILDDERTLARARSVNDEVTALRGWASPRNHAEGNTS
jgi:hypothetical protein